MAKVVFRKLGRGKSERAGTTISERWVRDVESGRRKIVRTISVESETLANDLTYVFRRNVAKARRENKAVTGVFDRVPSEG